MGSGRTDGDEIVDRDVLLRLVSANGSDDEDEDGVFDMFSTASLTSVWDSAIVTPERFLLASGCEDDEGLAYRGIGGSGFW
eukprot:COSAG06_NODE_9355_length_1921_cov_146.652580_2_plen_81_part_00